MKAITFSLAIWCIFVVAIQFLECKFTEPVSIHLESTETSSDSPNIENAKNPSLPETAFAEHMEPDSEVSPSIIPWSNSVLTLLKKSECATCHTKSFPTAKAGALEFFNLEEVPWYSRLSESNLSGLSNRILGNSKFLPEEQEALKQFINCFQGKDCKSES